MLMLPADPTFLQAVTNGPESLAQYGIATFAIGALLYVVRESRSERKEEREVRREEALTSRAMYLLAQTILDKDRRKEA